MFDEKTESRWSAQINKVDSADIADIIDDLKGKDVVTDADISVPILPPEVLQKLNDVDDYDVNFTSRSRMTRRKTEHRRVGSDDFMPIRPDRRASQSTILLPGQLQEIMQYDELSKLCDAIDFEDSDA